MNGKNWDPHTTESSKEDKGFFKITFCLYFPNDVNFINLNRINRPKVHLQTLRFRATTQGSVAVAVASVVVAAVVAVVVHSSPALDPEYPTPSLRPLLLR